ncbi:hypothetical protein [Sulfurovum sp.]|uniref:hypothetical protein n=1 Tax=Sulfurovum sp. TaxID=1969726 RepID=UPI003566E09B
MNLRKDIETLLYWYIPVFIFASVVGSYLFDYFKTIENMTFAVKLSLTVTTILSKYLHHIVVAVWLLNVAKKENQKYILWAMFGLVAHLFAAVIYLLLYVYERKCLADTANKAQEPIKNPRAAF